VLLVCVSSGKAFLRYPSWLALFNLIPVSREHIENKIMERFFMKIHKLPSNFDFAKYLYYLFQSYIVSLGQVSTFGWMLVMFCVVMNYFRLMVIDPAVSDCIAHPHEDDGHHDDHYEAEHDDHYYADHNDHDDVSHDDHYAGGGVDDHDDHGTHRAVLFGARRLLVQVLGAPVHASTYIAGHMTRKVSGQSSGGEEEVETDDGFSCIDRYDLSFAIFCSIILVMFILLTYLFANIYYDRMIERCANVGFKTRISFENEEGGRTNYAKCLEELIALENSHEIDHSVLAQSVRLPTSPHGDGETTTIPKLWKRARKEVSREIHEEIVIKKEPLAVQTKEFFHELIHGYERQFEHIEWHEENLPNPYKGLFVADIPGMFFLAVELSVFVQCFYIAIWGTQLLPVAKQAEDGYAWALILTIPVVMNFFIVRHTLVIAVMLKGFIELDHKLVSHVCHDITEEAQRLEDLGKRVGHKHKKYNEQFAKLNIPLPPVIIVIHMLNQHIKGSSYEFGKVEFRKFLGKHNMFLDHDQFRALWQCIDVNLSGTISWDEVFVTMFPEMQESIKRLVSITEKLRARCGKQLQSQYVGFYKKWSRLMQKLGLQPRVPVQAWREYLEDVARGLEDDKAANGDSTLISIEKFYRMVCELKVFEGNAKHAAFDQFFRDVMPAKQNTEFLSGKYYTDHKHPSEATHVHSPARDMFENNSASNNSASTSEKFVKHYQATMTKEEFYLLVDPIYYYETYVKLPDDVYENDENVISAKGHDKSFSFSTDELVTANTKYNAHNAHTELHHVVEHTREAIVILEKHESDSDLSEGEEDNRHSSLFTTVRHNSEHKDHHAHNSSSHHLVSGTQSAKASFYSSSGPKDPHNLHIDTGAEGSKHGGSSAAGSGATPVTATTTAGVTGTFSPEVLPITPKSRATATPPPLALRGQSPARQAGSSSRSNSPALNGVTFAGAAANKSPPASRPTAPVRTSTHKIPSLQSLNTSYSTRSATAGGAAMSEDFGIAGDGVSASTSKSSSARHALPSLAELNSGIYVSPQERERIAAAASAAQANSPTSSLPQLHEPHQQQVFAHGMKLQSAPTTVLRNDSLAMNSEFAIATDAASAAELLAATRPPLPATTAARAPPAAPVSPTKVLEAAGAGTTRTAAPESASAFSPPHSAAAAVSSTSASTTGKFPKTSAPSVAAAAPAKPAAPRENDGNADDDEDDDFEV
jgi:hypothetical protein